MARILYGINGEGMGHAVRSRVVIEHLLKQGNEIFIVTSNRAYKLLSTHFENVFDVHGLRMIYKNNKVLNLRTGIYNLSKITVGAPKSLHKLIKIIKNFKPQIIISDLELYTNYVAKLFRIPLLCIDNNHAMAVSKVKMPLRYKKDYIIAKLIVKSQVNRAKFYILTTFFDINPTIENIKIFSPILREEVLGAKPKDGDYYLVYQTSDRSKNTIKILKKVDEKFIVYGFHKNLREGNLIFREFSEKNFIDDLKNCKAVITNGGFTLMTEALYLRKPILSIPIRKQFEQILNCLSLERMGYGKFNPRFTKKVLQVFIDNLDIYKDSLKSYKRYKNDELLEELDKLIYKYAKSSS